MYHKSHSFNSEALLLRLLRRIIISLVHLPHRPGCHSTSPWHTLPLRSVYRFQHHNTSFYSPDTEKLANDFNIDTERKKYYIEIGLAHYTWFMLIFVQLNLSLNYAHYPIGMQAVFVSQNQLSNDGGTLIHCSCMGLIVLHIKSLP